MQNTQTHSNSLETKQGTVKMKDAKDDENDIIDIDPASEYEDDSQ